jgi:hypothetical protein
LGMRRSSAGSAARAMASKSMVMRAILALHE